MYSDSENTTNYENALNHFSENDSESESDYKYEILTFEQYAKKMKKLDLLKNKKIKYENEINEIEESKEKFIKKHGLEYVNEWETLTEILPFWNKCDIVREKTVFLGDYHKIIWQLHNKYYEKNATPYWEYRNDWPSITIDYFKMVINFYKEIRYNGINEYCYEYLENCCFKYMGKDTIKIFEYIYDNDLMEFDDMIKLIDKYMLTIKDTKLINFFTNKLCISMHINKLILRQKYDDEFYENNKLAEFKLLLIERKTVDIKQIKAMINNEVNFILCDNIMDEAEKTFFSNC